jgi:poly-gamma-glutamate synthesis protein (capsule biosynthesis protein)
LALGALSGARAHADVVVVAVHWGRDFASGPRGDLRGLADELVGAGADVVLGSGPHVLHTVERRESARGDAVVAYSLGNFVSGMGRAYRVGHPPRSVRHAANEVPEALDAVMLEVSVARTDERIRIAPLHATPLFTDNNWMAHRESGGSLPNLIRVRTLADMPPDVRAERAPIIARALGPEVTLR